MLPVLVLVAGFIAMMLLLGQRTDPPKRAPEARAKIVETAVVKLGSVQTEIVAYGRVTSSQPIQLFSEVSGILEQGDVPFKPAQSFSRGDLLVKIDDRQARFNLNSVKSDLLTALASVLPEIKVDFPDEYQIWQDYFNSCEFDRRLTPLPETDNAKIKLFLSRFSVYKLYFTVSDLEILLDKHYIYAPFDGSIVSTALRVGSTARMGSLLGEIINLEELEVAVPVEVSDLQWMDRTKRVRFTSSEVDGEWAGRMTRVGSHIDTRTQTVDVYISIDDGQEGSLLNGVFLEAHIPGKSIAESFAVPPKAVYDDRYVYLIEDGKLATRDVVILRREASQIILNGGLENGDVVVTEIMQGVAPGMPAQSRNGIDGNRGL